MRIAQEEFRHPDTGVYASGPPVSPFAKGLTGGLTNNNGDQRVGRDADRGGNEDSSGLHGGESSVVRLKDVCPVE